MIVLAAYLAFLGALLFYATGLEREVRGKSDSINAAWSVRMTAALENFFILNGRNAAWNEKAANCSIGERVICRFRGASSSSEVFGGLNESQAWKQPV